MNRRKFVASLSLAPLAALAALLARHATPDDSLTKWTSWPFCRLGLADKAASSIQVHTDLQPTLNENVEFLRRRLVEVNVQGNELDAMIDAYVKAVHDRLRVYRSIENWKSYPKHATVTIGKKA
jgi:hypothetical protein